MERHNSCINSLAIIQYLEDRSPERADELFQDLGTEMKGIEDSKAFLSDPNNWISSRLLIKLYDRAKQILDEKDAAYHIGFNSVTAKRLGYIQKIVMYAFGNTAKVLRHAQRVNDHFNRTKEVEILELTDNSAVVRLFWNKSIPLSKDFCLMNKGVYRAFPIIFGLPPMYLKETKCFFSGGDFCEYRLKWENKPLLQNIWHRFIAPWKVAWASTEEVERDKLILREKYKQVHQLNKSLQQKIDQLLSLQEIGNAIISTLKLEAVLDLSLKKLLNVAHLDRAGIFLCDEGHKTLKFIHAVGIDSDYMKELEGYEIPIDRKSNIIARTAESMQLVFVDDVEKECLNPDNPLLKQLKPEAFILVPLSLRGQVVGIVVGDRQNDRSFINEIDREFLKSFANQIAIAIENSNLYRKVKSSERKYREIVENVHDGIFMLDTKENFTFVNPHMEGILGVKNLVGSNINQLLNTGSKKIFEKIFKKNLAGEIAKDELYLKGVKGETIQVMLNSVPIFTGNTFDGSLAMVTDLTEKTKMEQQLRQAQKLEAIGTLAGGIAHDFNNILVAILGYTEMAKDEIPKSNPSQAMLDQVINASVRAKDLIKQILAFSRKNDQQSVPLDLAAIVKEILKLLRATLPKTIIISESIDSKSGFILADPTQIHQVLINLCTNAAQSMEKGGGHLKIGLKNIELTQDDLVQGQDLQPGRYVELTISDTGHGIDQSITERIFEPYFTTKDTGSGTGLGLAMVHGIVQTHKGMIYVKSKPGLGTTFTVLFPMIEAHIHKTQVDDAVPPKGNEHILFVDDEEEAGDIARQMYGKLGYTVSTFTDSIEAFAAFRENPEMFDLVITDQTMSKMTGDKLAKKILAIRPDIPIILCTGYSSIITKEQAITLGIKKYVMKPYQRIEISRLVREVLDENP